MNFHPVSTEINTPEPMTGELSVTLITRLPSVTRMIQSVAVSQYAYLSVLAFSRTRETSSVGGQVLFHFKECI